MSHAAVRWVFTLVGVYDAVIGLAFLVAGPQIFTATGVPHPNHWGYVQFGSLLLLVFGAMFFSVARDPVSNRNLIPYGIGLKLSYSGLVAYYWATSDLPFLFKPFAVVDAVTVVLFWMAYRARPATTPA